MKKTINLYKRKTQFKRNESVEGETLEMKLERVMNNKEPIDEQAPPIYTKRSDGVVPAYDIRTDRMEVALEAMDIVSKVSIAKSKNAWDERMKKEEKKSAETEPIQGTESAQKTE